MMILNLVKERLSFLKKAYYAWKQKQLGAWKFFLWVEKKGERQIRHKYYKQKEKTATNTDSIVIYMANSYTWHGGLADRLKGIVSLYAWCKDHGKSFRINFVHPFRLQNYLMPNHYDWLVADEDISYNPKESRVLQCLMNPILYDVECQKNIQSLLEGWLDDNLSYSEKQLHVYTNMRSGNARFSELFNELFKPVSRLQDMIDEQQRCLGNRYISVSFRFTTLLGDFTDCTGPALPVEERQPLISKCLDAILQLSKTAPAHDKILVTADSSTFLEQVSQLPDVYVIPGKVGHIDYDADDEVNLKTFLDFLLIAQAEAVYLVKAENMYNSAFAKTAAMVNNRPFTLIEI